MHTINSWEKPINPPLEILVLPGPPPTLLGGGYRKFPQLKTIFGSPAEFSTEWSIIIKKCKKIYYYCLWVNIILCCELCNIYVVNCEFE